MDTRSATQESPSSVHPELVIREARRRQRRRWMVAAAVTAVAVGATVAVVAVVGQRAPASHRTPPPASRRSGSTTSGLGVQPKRPGSLAIGPNGSVYMADDVRNQILERLPNGKFQAVVGNGTVGFAGDGGTATSAELNRPEGIFFGPDGTLYVADNGNGRIRAVSPADVIRTVAGDGGQLDWVADGTPALAASFSPTAMTFGPDGLMYVATWEQVLRLEPNGTFTRVLGENANQDAGLYGIGGPAVDASADGPDGLAFDSTGDLYVSGLNTKTILMVNPHGIVSVVGSVYPRGAGGLVTAPDGSVLAMDELEVVRLSPTGIHTIVQFPTTIKVRYLGMTGFSPNGIAVGPDGSIYLDTFYGNGYTDKSALVRIGTHGAASLLWQQ